MSKLLVINKLCCQRQHTTLFADLSFALDSGELMVIEGANGSGKSSLLRLLAGLATPSSGDIVWHGKVITDHAAEFKQQLYYLGHQNGLRLDLSIAENLSRCDLSLLAALHLDNHLHTSVRALSAGQKRKTALIKLFSSQKKLWLLDEPLTALDAGTQIFFHHMLQTHLQQGGVAIVSTHQPITIHSTINTLRLGI